MNLVELNALCQNTLISNLGIEFIELKDFNLVARMPVDERTIQPFGYLHGGALLALAETVGSAGSVLLVEGNPYHVMGSGISANHVKSKKQGYVLATGTIRHQGRSTHVWDVEIKDEKEELISICRITNMLVEKRDNH